MLTLNSSEKETLARTFKDAVKGSAEARFLHRLHCLQMMAQGCSAHEVAKWFNDDPSTVSRWVRHFKLFGVLGLQDDHKPGRPSKLDPDALRKLTRELGQQPRTLGHSAECWDGKLLAAHLESHYDVNMSVRQCQRLLRQLQQPVECQPIKSARQRIS